MFILRCRLLILSLWFLLCIFFCCLLLRLLKVCLCLWGEFLFMMMFWEVLVGSVFLFMLWVGVGRVVVMEVMELFMFIFWLFVLGENCEGFCGVWGWKDMMDWLIMVRWCDVVGMVRVIERKFLVWLLFEWSGDMDKEKKLNYK